MLVIGFEIAVLIICVATSGIQQYTERLLLHITFTDVQRCTETHRAIVCLNSRTSLFSNLIVCASLNKIFILFKHSVYLSGSGLLLN